MTALRRRRLISDALDDIFKEEQTDPELIFKRHGLVIMVEADDVIPTPAMTAAMILSAINEEEPRLVKENRKDEAFLAWSKDHVVAVLESADALFGE